MSPTPWPEDATWHAAGADGLFGGGALCGATPEEGESLRMHAVSTEVTCVECRRILLGGDS